MVGMQTLTARDIARVLRKWAWPGRIPATRLTAAATNALSRSVPRFIAACLGRADGRRC